MVQGDSAGRPVNAWAGAVLAGLALAIVGAAVPGPGRRFAGFPGDGPEPRYDRPLPAGELRHIGPLVAVRGTYFLAATTPDPLTRGNLKAAGMLFFSPALPLQSVREAGVIVTYDAAGRRMVIRPR